MKKICAIAAMDEGRVIGYRGGLPWKIPEDMKRFKDLTMGHAVLMGRRTYESLPSFAQPLPGRINIVLTSKPKELDAPERVLRYSSIEEALDAFQSDKLGSAVDLLWIIGGAEVYAQSVNLWDEIYLTLVHGKHEVDAYFPSFEEAFKLSEKEIKDDVTFLHYCREAAAV